MAVIIKATSPDRILRSIYRRIDEREIRTWAYDDAGDFTHTAAQWKERAWMRPRISDQGNLIANIVAPKGGLTRDVYAVYHGRFVEMILAHFEDDVEYAKATVQPLPSDLV